MKTQPKQLLGSHPLDIALPVPTIAIFPHQVSYTVLAGTYACTYGKRPMAQVWVYSIHALTYHLSFQTDLSASVASAYVLALDTVVTLDYLFSTINLILIYYPVSVNPLSYRPCTALLIIFRAPTCTSSQLRSPIKLDLFYLKVHITLSLAPLSVFS